MFIQIPFTRALTHVYSHAFTHVHTHGYAHVYTLVYGVQGAAALRVLRYVRRCGRMPHRCAQVAHASTHACIRTRAHVCAMGAPWVALAI